jgi:hypothetical protein
VKHAERGMHEGVLGGRTPGIPPRSCFPVGALNLTTSFSGHPSAAFHLGALHSRTDQAHCRHVGRASAACRSASSAAARQQKTGNGRPRAVRRRGSGVAERAAGFKLAWPALWRCAFWVEKRAPTRPSRQHNSVRKRHSEQVKHRNGRPCRPVGRIRRKLGEQMHENKA